MSDPVSQFGEELKSDQHVNARMETGGEPLGEILSVCRPFCLSKYERRERHVSKDQDEAHEVRRIELRGICKSNGGACL